jgi:hypothetical protein
MTQVSNVVPGPLISVVNYQILILNVQVFPSDLTIFYDCH